MPPSPMTLTFDLLTSKVVSESHVMWATSVPVLVFLDRLRPDVRDRQKSDVRCASSLNASALRGRGHNNLGLWLVRPLRLARRYIMLQLNLILSDSSNLDELFHYRLQKSQTVLLPILTALLHWI